MKEKIRGAALLCLLFALLSTTALAVRQGTPTQEDTGYPWAHWCGLATTIILNFLAPCHSKLHFVID